MFLSVTTAARAISVTAHTIAATQPMNVQPSTGANRVADYRQDAPSDGLGQMGPGVANLLEIGGVSQICTGICTTFRCT
jgi:hypothetical protein